jgi:hypothetical protein
MEFLNPTALLIPYLVRKRPRRLVFSSLLLFTQGRMQSGGRPLGRLHLPPIFFLQLLLLALLIFALSEPVFSIRPNSMAIVLDNSASMQALEEGKTRLTLAKEKAGALANEVGASGKIEVYTTTPRLERISAEALTPVEAKRLIGNIAANDLGDPPIDYGNMLSRLAQERKYQRVYLITDHPAGGQSAVARVISVGAAKPNLAVTDFEVHRSSLVKARLEANATVHNFSAKEEKVKLTLKTNGVPLATRELAVGADKTATAVFESIPEQPAYEAEIDARDALPLDNRRFAVAPTSRNLRILAVTPRPQALASLRSIPGVSVDVISPAEYEKFTRTGYGLEIFHFAAPGALPENPALFILPPESNSLVDLGPPAANAQVSSWREPHTLTRYINFSLFRPSYVRPLKPQTPGDVIIESPKGALAFSTERQGLRYIVLGFDPLPYLGRENLPMSIFTLNFLDWFFESGTTRAQATGEPIAPGSIQPTDIFINPAGDKISVKPGVDVFADTFQQGIYQRRRGGDRELYARNLTDPGESDLRAPAPIELHEPAKTSGTSSALFTFWPYLLLASLLLFFIEWFITPRITSVGLRQGSRPAVSRR